MIYNNLSLIPYSYNMGKYGFVLPALQKKHGKNIA